MHDALYAILSAAFEAYGVTDFHPEEFAPARREAPPIPYWTHIVPTAIVLQGVRSYFNAPTTIASGYRGPVYNKSIGGARYSQHILFTAADFTVRGYTPEEAQEYLKERCGWKMKIAVGSYPTFTHVDTRHWVKPTENPARWDGE